ncbi:phage virion morphogenesis protein [Luteimonas sp. FXH3W]|uniref:Phage virion morphogenesis protein n=1 Tax=Aquilutibacter rugosus TaxID=3115820 RepID=A0ABU7UXC4_9GAMM
MTDRFTIEVDSEDADRWFSKLTRKLDDLTPVMRDIGELLIESTQDRFKKSEGPDGKPWAPVKRGGRPLVKSGRMRDDIHSRFGRDFAEVRATARQAAFHQFGTQPYVILPRNKKALFWKGGPGPRHKVNHPGLPPRPFMGLSDDDRAKLDRLTANWLTED